MKTVNPNYTDRVVSEDEIGSLVMTASTNSLSSLNLPQPPPSSGLALLSTSMKSANDSWTHTSSDSATNYTANKPFPSKITKARYLSGQVLEKLSLDAAAVSKLTLEQKVEKLKGLGRRVLELEMTLPDDFSFEYSPGDAIGIIVSQSDASVSELMQRCGYGGEKIT